jgi:quercetin dioxygenase-like cupin family protein
MKTIKGQVFSLLEKNQPIPYLTISMDLGADVSIFSLGKDTDISSESYPFSSCVYVLGGKGMIGDIIFDKDDFMLVEKDVSVGKKTEDGIVYIEFKLSKENVMTNLIKPGEVYKLKDLIKYQENKVVNLDVFHTEKSKLALIAMAKGTKLDAHKAPGEALLFILDGEGTISYEGKDYKVHQGDNFSFAKGGLHAVSADENLQFALLLELC